MIFPDPRNALISKNVQTIFSNINTRMTAKPQHTAFFAVVRQECYDRRVFNIHAIANLVRWLHTPSFMEHEKRMTAAELDRKPPMADVCVTRRLSGATNVPGKLIRVVPHIRHLPPVALVQFPDGVEPVDPEYVVNHSSQITPAIVNLPETHGGQLSLL